MKLHRAAVFFFFGLAPLAGCALHNYSLASHGPHDPSAGDITHASEPGAKVVVPKKQKVEQPTEIAADPRYQCDPPHSDGTIVCRLKTTL